MGSSIDSLPSPGDASAGILLFWAIFWCKGLGSMSLSRFVLGVVSFATLLYLSFPLLASVPFMVLRKLAVTYSWGESKVGIFYFSLCFLWGRPRRFQD